MARYGGRRAVQRLVWSTVPFGLAFLHYAILAIIGFNLQPIRISAKIRAARKYVILSSDDKYSANVPITTLLWIIETNFIPLVLIWSSVDERVAAEAPLLRPLFELKHKVPKIELVLLPSPINMNSATLAQVSRLCPCLLAKELGLIDDDVLMVSDIDMWPTDRLYWDNFAAVGPNDIRSFNFHCCGTLRHKGVTHIHLAMCHIAARVASWRKILGVFDVAFDNVGSRQLGWYIKNLTLNEFNYHGEVPRWAGPWWYLDERVLSYGVAKLTSEDPTVRLDGWVVDVPRLRINRGDGWHPTFNETVMRGKVQAHVYHDRGGRNAKLFEYLLSHTNLSSSFESWTRKWLRRHFSWWSDDS